MHTFYLFLTTQYLLCVSTRTCTPVDECVGTVGRGSQHRVFYVCMFSSQFLRWFP